MLPSKSYYLQPLPPNSENSGRSPLELLAETCSNIGSDSPSSSPPTIASPVKFFSSTKHSTSSKLKSTPKKPSPSLKSHSSPLVKPKSLYNSYPPSFDPRISLVFHPSFPYSTSPVHSYPRAYPLPQCSQCVPYGTNPSSSLTDQSYVCQQSKCRTRLSSSEELVEHNRYTHKSSKTSHQRRFHPYSKSSRTIDISDQSPYFHPHLPLSAIVERIPRMYYDSVSNHQSLY